MVKFLPQGTLKLQVQAAGGTEWYTVPQGLTIRFSIDRKALPDGSQTAQFRIYNLSKVTRNQVFKDRFDGNLDRMIAFSAGYPDFTPQLFVGYILQAYSDKEGPENVVTVIDAFQAFPTRNGFTSMNVPPGTTGELRNYRFSRESARHFITADRGKFPRY